MRAVAVAELQAAFEDMLRRYLEVAPNSEQAVRDAWPLDNLTQECGEVFFNGSILTVSTRSGFGSWGHPDRNEVDVAPDASDEVLGQAVNEALSCSRELSLRDLLCAIRSVGRDEREAEYKQWTDRFMQRHGYASKRTMFKKMLHCRMVRRAGSLSISPSNHDSLEGWSPLPETENVVIPSDSAAAEIGEAVRLSLARCIG